MKNLKINILAIGLTFCHINLVSAQTIDSATVYDAAQVTSRSTPTLYDSVYINEVAPWNEPVSADLMDVSSTELPTSYYDEAIQYDLQHDVGFDYTNAYAVSQTDQEVSLPVRVAICRNHTQAVARPGFNNVLEHNQASATAVKICSRWGGLLKIIITEAIQESETDEVTSIAPVRDRGYPTLNQVSAVSTATIPTSYQATYTNTNTYSITEVAPSDFYVIDSSLSVTVASPTYETVSYDTAATTTTTTASSTSTATRTTSDVVDPVLDQPVRSNRP